MLWRAAGLGGVCSDNDNPGRLVGGGTVTAIQSGSVATLTASVSAGTAAVTAGQVKFCDASAAYCTDIHVLGVGQLTSAGTATIKSIPGIGNHSYKAVFLGTAANAASTSATATLNVTGLYPTTTAIAQSGSAGNYSLTATVMGSGGLISPTGTVSFVDTSNGNAVLGTAALGASASSLSFLNPRTRRLAPILSQLLSVISIKTESQISRWQTRATAR